MKRGTGTSRTTRRSTHGGVLAHHLIFYAYGQWLANDPRGSGSTELRNPRLADLGPIHLGRKPAPELPSIQELRAFYRDAEPRLQHDTLWFDAACRDTIARAFAETIAARGYTCWACAIVQNHAHLLIRRHRDRGAAIWDALAAAVRTTVQVHLDLPNHPIWAARPYTVFKNTPNAIRQCVTYIEGNPEKHHLPPQPWPFIQPYDGWPFHKPK